MVGVRWLPGPPAGPEPPDLALDDRDRGAGRAGAIAAESPVKPAPMMATSTAPSPRHGGAGASMTSSIHRLGGGPPGSCIAPPSPPW
jgi:hypothetical protein